MFYLEVEDDFASAHQLRGYRGKCENLHGHNWKVMLTVKGEQLDHLGMLVDFTVLKQLMKDVLGGLDHRFLNDTPPFDTINPTSELIAKFIAETLAPRLPAGIAVDSVRVWESDRCSATYKFQ